MKSDADLEEAQIPLGFYPFFLRSRELRRRGLPCGQEETHIPQGCSLRYSLHLKTSKRISRGSSGRNSVPVKAFTGQESTQT